MTEDVEPRTNLNAEIAGLFAEIGDILEVKGEQPYRYNAYRVAARSVGSARERMDILFAAGRLRELNGVGSALEAKIVEYLKTGQMEFYDRLRREFPSALATLLQIPGLGPGKARSIYQQLGVTTVAELEQAAREGRLKDVAGFGDKGAQSLLENLERMRQRISRDLLSTGWAAVEEVREALGRPAEDDRIAVVGSVRRMQDSVGGLDLLAARDAGEDGERLLAGLLALPNVVQVVSTSADQAAVLLFGGLTVRLTILPRNAWGSGLVWYTGSKAHVARLEQLARERGWVLTALGLEDDATGKRLESASEVGIYERLGLPWIPPELREDSGEIEAAQAGTLPKLIELQDIKGDLHTHTNWTDGTKTLDEMATAAKAKGYQYMALTDHSQTLTLTRGLTPERLEEQRAIVRRVNQKLAPFVVLHGTEMDILLDGQLDFTDEVLGSLDYVSASVHSGFRQPEAEMTARILRAIANPLVNTLNHPHGRKIRVRPGYKVDTERMLEAAAKLGCALELNSDPDRLDLNGTWARQAKDLGARFTISSDAHSIKDLEFMQFGVGSARRGWLTATDVLNTRPLEELRALLAQRRPGLKFERVWTSLGETLRQARLDKGVSLAEAARDTRIRRTYLEALEAEDTAQLPAAVYTRGFLRTYADYLGLNAQSMIDLYQPQARRESGPTLRAAVPRVAIPRQIPLRPALYGLGGIGFLVVLFFAWNWYQDVQASLREGDTSLRAVRAGTPTPVGPRVPTPFPIAVVSPSPTVTPTPEPPTPTPTSTPVVDGILVEFRTNARVYVEASVDGQQVLAETLAAGTQRQLPLGRESVIMRASIGSAIEVIVNGARQEPPTGQEPVEFTWRR